MSLSPNDFSPAAAPRQGVPFNPFVFAILLIIVVVAGLLSNVNHDGISGFWPSVQNAWQVNDYALLLSFVLSVVLVLWLVAIGIGMLVNALRAAKRDDQISEY